MTIRIPAKEITGPYGALVKVFSKRMFGRVPESLGVMWHNVPVLGYFDDAIAIELCVRELRHELDAYEEFCDFRQGEADRRGMDPAVVGRADWLARWLASAQIPSRTKARISDGSED